MIRNWDKLKEFCSTDCDRFAFLQKYLQEAGLNTRILESSGSRNIFLDFPQDQYGSGVQIKVLTAHYDRTPQSPGANDNSAAVFQLADLAVRLLRRGRKHNTLIIFTDHEEITEDNPSVRTQGAYKLGSYLHRWLKSESTQFAFFNFDLCGIGDTLILSTANETLLEKKGLAGTPIYRRTRELRETAMDVMGRVRECPFFALETPFSDNIGLLLNGFPSVLITMLPYQEAVQYRSRYRMLSDELKRSGDLSGTPDFLQNSTAGVLREKIRDIIPRTWERMHCEDDRIETLEEGAFRLMEQLLDRFAATEIPLSRFSIGETRPLPQYP